MRAVERQVNKDMHLTYVRQFALITCVVIVCGCGTPPQVVDDPECFKAVDALWTSLTAKRPDLLEKSSAELVRLRDAGKLSPAGWRALEPIVAGGRAAKWTDAARDLNDFIRGQRRQTPLR